MTIRLQNLRTIAPNGGVRLFVSLPLPVELASQLEDFLDVRRDADRTQARQRGGGTDWSWTLSDQWHLTLAFAGDVTPEGRESWGEALAEVAARTDPFVMQLGGAGTFPHPDAAKVLYLRAVSTDPGPDALPHLAHAARTSAHRVGVHGDGQPFIPHVTVARSRRGVSAIRWLRIMDSFAPRTWQVTSFDLVESQWGGAGRRAVHRVLDRFELGVSAPLGG